MWWGEQKIDPTGILLATTLLIAVLHYLLFPRYSAPQPSNNPDVIQQEPLSILPLADSNAFGRRDVAPPTPPPEIQPAIPTPSRNLALLGTFTDSEEGLASALVALDGRSAERWFVGDTIDDGLVLISVHPNKIEYTEDETLRTLDFGFIPQSSRTAPYPSRKAREAMLEEEQDADGDGIQPPRRHTPIFRDSQP